MVLIVGGDSEIGAATAEAMKASGLLAATTRRSERTSPDRPFLDLAAPVELWEPPPQAKTACLCAGVARMAACEADPQASSRINVQQTLALVDKLLARDIYVLFLSTNQVFNGRLPHVPPDAPYSPASEYGRQKMRTEIALRAHMARGAPVAILRLAKVVSPDMPLIAGWITDLSSGKPVRAFRDMRLAPAPIGLVCAAIGALLSDRVSGIFQLTGPRDATYAEVARFLAARLGADAALVKETNAKAAGLPEGATPSNTTLDSTLLGERYAIEAPDAWEVVGQVLVGRDRRKVQPLQASR